jgi:hypothetical protein
MDHLQITAGSFAVPSMTVHSFMGRRMRKVLTSSLMALCLVACDAGRTMSPNIAGSSGSKNCAAMSGHCDPARASGHIERTGTVVQGIQYEQYSFVAIATDGSNAAKGQVSAHALLFDGRKWRLHAEVTCLAVQGKRAWIGARIISIVLDGQPEPGGVIVFSVEDNGEGQATMDPGTLLFFGSEGDDLTYCANRPDRPPRLGETVVAQVQVTGG